MYPESVVFKKVLPKDWKKFKEIRLEGLQTDPQAFGSNFTAEVQEGDMYWKEKHVNPDRYYYAADDGSQFVAIGGVKKISDDHWTIIAVYTLSAYRGKKISQELLRRIMEDVKNDGAKKVSLSVNVTQESAVAIYKKIGFEIIRTEKDEMMGDGKTYDEYYMEKVLA